LKQILEFHNCFVNESITAYENMANIEVHSKQKTTSTSNHAVNLSSAFSPSLLQPFFASEEVSASATSLLQFLLLQWSYSLTPCLTQSSSVSEEASTSSCCQFELTSSDLQVLNELSDLDELSLLNSSVSVTSHYNLCSHSVVDEPDTHISYVYAAIFIDDIVKLTTYKQAVKSSLCDKWKTAMKDKIQSLKNNNT